MKEDDLRTIPASTAKHYGEHISPFSMRRWVSKGVGQPPVKLKATRIGGRYFVRDADVLEFQKAISDPVLFHQRQQVARVETAKKRLVKAGA